MRGLCGGCAGAVRGLCGGCAGAVRGLCGGCAGAVRGLLWFFLHIRSSERTGKEPLLSSGLFRNRSSNLGLVTQNIQWLLLMGITFVVSVFLQTERGFSAIKTGVIFTAATAGILISSLSAERLAKKYAQRT